MNEVSVSFKYRKTSGGYAIQKTVRKNGIPQSYDIFLTPKVAREFADFVKSNPHTEPEMDDNGKIYEPLDAA